MSAFRAVFVILVVIALVAPESTAKVRYHHFYSLPFAVLDTSAFLVLGSKEAGKSKKNEQFFDFDNLLFKTIHV